MDSKNLAYGRFVVDSATKYNLRNLCKRLGLDAISDEFHTTVLYSTENVDRLLAYKPSLSFPLVADVVGYEVFGDEKNCLVLKLDHPDLHNVFNELKSLGASYDYDSYIPHLTLTYSFKGEIPSKLPKFKVKLAGYKSELSSDDFDVKSAEVVINEEKKPMQSFNEAVNKGKIVAFASKFKNTDPDSLVLDNAGISSIKLGKDLDDLMKMIVSISHPNYANTCASYVYHDKAWRDHPEEKGFVVKPVKGVDAILMKVLPEQDRIVLLQCP